MTSSLLPRRTSIPVDVGGVIIGGNAPIVVQSMTNTDTADVEGTARQCAALARAGSEIVRVTVDRDEAAKAVPHIRDRLAQMGAAVPLVGDFHYNGHTLLTENPACAEALDKYRINPGNVGFKAKRDRQFSAIVELALKHAKPVRIGVNWGSLDQELLTRLMDENAASPKPKDARAILHEAIVQSGLLSAERAEELGMKPEQIVISAKVSAVQDLVSVYAMLAARCRYALHLGLTEAGMGSKGIVASTAAMGILLQQGIGDTIRVSLTPEPGGDRTQEVRVAQEILQTMGLRSFVPIVAACPGCGRTTSTVFQELASDIQGYVRERMAVWRGQYPGVESLNLAVMGCIVNGPGESKHADIGISLPGTGEAPTAPVFIDGKKAMTLRGANIAAEFKAIVEDYVARRYGQARARSRKSRRREALVSALSQQAARQVRNGALASPLTDARVQPAAISSAQRRQQQRGQCADGPLAKVGKEPVKLLVEERIDQALTIASVQGAIDADDAPFVVDVAVVAHAVINDPAPPLAPAVDEDRADVDRDRCCRPCLGGACRPGLGSLLHGTLPDALPLPRVRNR